MKAKVLAAILVLALLATSIIPVARLLASGEVMCQPDLYEVKSYSTTVTVQLGKLNVRYYYPDARRQKGQAIIFGNYFAADTLPGVILVPATNQVGQFWESTGKGIGDRGTSRGCNGICEGHSLG